MPSATANPPFLFREEKTLAKRKKYVWLPIPYIHNCKKFGSILPVVIKVDLPSRKVYFYSASKLVGKLVSNHTYHNDSTFIIASIFLQL